MTEMIETTDRALNRGSLIRTAGAAGAASRWGAASSEPRSPARRAASPRVTPPDSREIVAPKRPLPSARPAPAAPAVRISDPRLSARSVVSIISVIACSPLSRWTSLTLPAPWGIRLGSRSGSPVLALSFSGAGAARGRDRPPRPCAAAPGPDPSARRHPRRPADGAGRPARGEHGARRRAVTGIGRRGKYLLFGLETGGRRCPPADDGLVPPSLAGGVDPRADAIRAVFQLDNGATLLYCDQRRFGTMR